MLPIQCLIGFKRLSKSSGGLHFYEIITLSLMKENYGGSSIKICFKSNLNVYFKSNIWLKIKGVLRVNQSYPLIRSINHLQL